MTKLKVTTVTLNERETAWISKQKIDALAAHRTWNVSQFVREKIDEEIQRSGFVMPSPSEPQPECVQEEMPPEIAQQMEELPEDLPPPPLPMEHMEYEPREKPRNPLDEAFGNI